MSLLGAICILGAGLCGLGMLGAGLVSGDTELAGVLLLAGAILGGLGAWLLDNSAAVPL